MELAKSSTSLERAAKQLGRSPDAVKRMALRLGLALRFEDGQEGLTAQWRTAAGNHTRETGGNRSASSGSVGKAEAGLKTLS